MLQVLDEVVPVLPSQTKAWKQYKQCGKYVYNIHSNYTRRQSIEMHLVGVWTHVCPDELHRFLVYESC